MFYCAVPAQKRLMAKRIMYLIIKFFTSKHILPIKLRKVHFSKNSKFLLAFQDPGPRDCAH